MARTCMIFFAALLLKNLEIMCYPQSIERFALEKEALFGENSTPKRDYEYLIKPSRPIVNRSKLRFKQVRLATEKLQNFPMKFDQATEDHPYLMPAKEHKVIENSNNGNVEKVGENFNLENKQTEALIRNAMQPSIFQHKHELSQWNYKLHIKLKCLHKNEAETVNMINSAIRLISTYFGDKDASLIVPITYEFNDNTLLLTWSNSTIDNQPTCSQMKLIQSLSTRIFSEKAKVRPDFERAFEPEFLLLDANEERNRNCSEDNLMYIHGFIVEEIILKNHPPLPKINKRRQRRNVALNNPPEVKEPLPTFNASYCSLFFFPISESVFLDQEDGNTRNLTLSLLDKNRTSVNLRSWIQLDTNLQTLYGYLKASDSALANSEYRFDYLLRATDSAGLSVEAPFSVKIPNTIPTIFFKVSLTINSFEDPGKPYVNEAIFLAYKILRYFNDNYFATVNVLEFTRSHSANHRDELVTFGWTNCTLKGPGCPVNLIDSYKKRLVTEDGKPNPNFSDKLKPQYNVYNITVEKAGICLPLSSTIFSRITPTPAYSLSPIIRRHIPELAVYTTISFRYQIPWDTFYDNIDGFTRSLRLELRTSTNLTLTTNSWIQFQSQTQTIIGILMTNIFSGSSPMIFNYLLMATNSRGYSSHLLITLRGNRESFSFGALFSISGRDNSLSSTNDITILETTLRKLRSYVNDKRNDTVEVTSFSRLLTGQQKIFSLVFANTSITTQDCTGLQRLVPLFRPRGTLINQDLTVSLVPEIVADRIDIIRYGACSYVQNMSIIPSPTVGGLFPVSNSRVPVITIKTGLFFSYQVPAETFYDANDGDTRKLRLQVTFSNGNILNHDSWVQFDTAAQMIYGLLPSNQQSVRPFQNITLLLQATNSLGYSALQIITIQSEYKFLDAGITVSFNGREFNANQWNDVQLQNFMLSQLRDYFSIMSNETIQMMSFNHQAHGSSSFIASWTDSRLIATNCDLALLHIIESKVFSAKDTVNPNLIAKMLPNIVLTNAEISYYGQCLRNTASITMTISPTPTEINAPRYANIVPVINVTAGFPFTYQIPHDTFMDDVDGNTRSLFLNLSNSNGSPIIITSSVQFNTTRQMLAGIFFANELEGSFYKDFHYILTALNSRKFKTSADLIVRVTASRYKPGVVISTTANTFYNQVTSIVHISSDFLQLISSYVPNSLITDFNIISLKHISSNIGQTVVTWSYNKINGSKCNDSELAKFLSLLVKDDGQLNPNFINAVAPNFIVFSSTSKRLNGCSNKTHHIGSTMLPINIMPSTSYPSHFPQVMSSVVTPNTPPKVTSKILPLFAYFCARFSYTVPNDLFHDQEEGGTRNLKLQLETHDRKQVNTSSWLQYSDRSQVLYGILKVDDFYKMPPGGYRFYLTATDKQGLQASTDLSITIPSFSLKYNHVITMQLNRVFDNSVPDINEQLLISTKILEFFQDANTNSVNIISYTRSPKSNNAVIKWSNCSMTYSPCPHADLTAMLNRLVDSSGQTKDSFRRAMLSHYTIQSLTVERLSPCNFTEQTTSTVPFTVSPSPSLLPVLPPFIQTRLSQLNLSWCAPFQFQIPENTFYDIYDGTTRNLTLSLLHTDGSPLQEQYWFKFVAKTQQIHAYPTLSDISSYESKHFILIARNRRNLTAQQNIRIAATKPKPNPNHQLRVTTSAYVTSAMQDIDIRILIWKKMKEYFMSNQTEIISFTNYARSGLSPSQISFTFSNCSLSEDACDRSALDVMLQKIFAAPGIINSQFITAFGPEIVVTDVKVENLGICSSYVLTQSLSQSTVSYPMKSSVATNPPKNQPPLVLQNIGNLQVDSCSIFTYLIPERTFFDVEDGLTRNLKLAVTYREGSVLRNDSWITFDAKAQILKGIITKEDWNDLQFLLTATDSGGLTVTQKIQFNVKWAFDSFIVNTKVIDYTAKASSKSEVLEQFTNRLSKYLGDSGHVSIQIFSFNRTANQTLEIAWSICNFKGSCNATALATVKSKILVTDFILSPNFVIALGPTFIVTAADIRIVVSCSSLPPGLSTEIASVSLPVHTSVIYSSTVPNINTAPVFVKKIQTLQISSCSPFSVKLPTNLCFDREDGFAKISILITYRNGTHLTSHSLLQISKDNATIYGVVKESDLMPNGKLKEKFLITCQDSKGLRTSTALNTNVTEYSVGKGGYSLTFHTYIYPLSTFSNVEIQLLWIKKFQDYIRDQSANNVYFLNFERVSSMQAEFSIRLCYLDMCNSSAVQYLRNKIFATIPDLNPQFIAAMIPEFSLVSTGFQAPSAVVCPIFSTINPTQSLSYSQSLTSAIFNNPVRALRAIQQINATLCSKFVYKIPEDTFYDPDEGYTANLTVSLHYKNGSVVGTDSWLQYDHVKLTITGYAVRDSLSRSSSTLVYKLIAKDRRASTAEVNLVVNIFSQNLSLSHGFLTEADLYGNFKDNVEIMVEVANKVKAYIGKPLDSGLVFISFVKYSLNRPKIVFSWSSCSLIKSCDSSELKAISDKLLFSGTILNFEVIAALAPNILVTRVRPLSADGCTVIQTPQNSLVTSLPVVSSFPVTTPTPLIRPTSHVPKTILLSMINTDLVSPSSASSLAVLSSSIPSRPSVQNPLTSLTANLCTLLMFRIPRDTFYDNIDGDTRNLSVTARLQGYSRIPDDFWIDFKTDSQTFIGQATLSVVYKQPDSGYIFIVRATNKRTFFTETTIVVRISTLFPPINHNITISLEEISSGQIENVDLVSLVRDRITSYFGGTSNSDIGILSYERNRTSSKLTSIIWYNCSLANIGCDVQNLRTYFSKIVSQNGAVDPNFSAAFLPTFQVKNVETTISDVCLSFSLRTSLLPRIDSTVILPTFFSVSYTSIFSSILSSSSVTKQNTPPVSLKMLIISIPYCGGFRFKIPNDTFYDMEDGGAYNLEISLLSTDESPLDCNSTLQFNRTSMELSGQIPLSHWKDSKTFLLQARDKQGRTATTNVTMKAPHQPKFATFAVTFSIKPLEDTCIANLLQELNAALTRFLGLGNISIISLDQAVSNGLVNITWTECSAYDAPCNHSLIGAVQRRIVQNNTVNPDVYNLLLPKHQVKSVAVFRSDICNAQSSISITISLCSRMNYTLSQWIYNSTVIDTQNQNRLRLTYELTGTNGVRLPWTELAGNSVIVMPVYNALKNRSTTHLRLNARLNAEVIKTIKVVLHHADAMSLKINYTIDLKIISYKPTSWSDIKLIESIIIPIANYTNASSNEYVVIDYNRTKIYPEMLHVSITPCISLGKCNSTQLNSLTNSLALGNGIPTYEIVKAMLPDFVLTKLDITKMGDCQNDIPKKNDSYKEIIVPLCTKLFTRVDSQFVMSGKNITADIDYELLSPEGKNLSLYSWVQFDKIARVVYGIPTQQNLIDQPENGYLYTLRSNDELGHENNMVLNITVIGSKTKPNYTQTLIFQSLAESRTSDAKVLLDFHSKLSSLLGNSTIGIGFISYKRRFDASQMSMLEITNCSLFKASVLCPANTVNLLSGMLVTDNGQPTEAFSRAVQPNYTVVKIIKKRTRACANTSNTVPRIASLLPELNASTCARLQYKIPDDTFLDQEDGNTTSLTLYLKTTNLTFLPESSWIQLNMLTRTIYGIPTYDVIAAKPSNGYSFVLQAQDKEGAITSLPLHVNLHENVTDRSLVNILMETTMLTNMARIEIQRKFIENSAKCLNISEKDIAVAYYRLMGGFNKQINISIFHNCSSFLSLCDEASTRNFFQKVVSNSSVRVKYKECMYPDFSVIKIDLTISNSCLNITRNTQPKLNRAIPQLNLTACEVLYFQITNDTFVDVEDGAKIFSNMELVRSNGNPLQPTDFVQFNKSSMTLYALYSELLKNMDNASYEYLLHARDTEGEIAIARVRIKVDDNKPNSTYRICLSLRQYSQAFQADIDIIIDIAKRIERFLSDGRASQNVTIRNYTITQMYPRNIDLCFSNCNLSDGKCHKESVDFMKRSIFLRDDVINQSFRQALGPDFVIIKAFDLYSAHCYVTPLPSTVAPTISISPSLTSSFVTATPLHHCVSGQNTVPKIINSVGSLTVYVGRPMVYSIQRDIVYDKEDGYLKVKLTDMNGQALQNQWMHFDENEQMIFASVLENQRDSFHMEQIFRLVATDSCGATVYDVLTVMVLGSVSCCYTIQIYSNVAYEKLSKNFSLQYQFYRTLSSIYNDTQDQIRLYSISNETDNYNGTMLAYTNSSFTNESCFQYMIKPLSYPVFHANGTAKATFVSQFSDFKVVGVSEGNNSKCNGTFIPIIPVVIPLPGTTSALTYEDWLWYILPFIILAFLVICCCFLFYWCTACRETCCGGAKKSDDLFSAAAAKPIQEEVTMAQAAAVFQEEDPDAVAAAAPNQLTEPDASKAPVEDFYAQIAATDKVSSVPSLHKTKHIPPWMTAASKAQAPNSPSDSIEAKPLEEPIVQGAAALPQEHPADTAAGPVTSGVASLPKEPAVEEPINATYSQNMHRRPSYLMTPSTSIVSVDEDPMNLDAVPMTQGQPDRPRISEDQIQPVHRGNLEAALGPSDPASGVSALPNPIEENPIETGEHPLFNKPTATSGPTLRLPSTPLLSPGEPPPPYSPPKPRKERPVFVIRPSRSFGIKGRPVRNTTNTTVLKEQMPLKRFLPIKKSHARDQLYDADPLYMVYPRKPVRSAEARVNLYEPSKNRLGFIRRTLSGARRGQIQPKPTPYRESKFIERSPQSMRKQGSLIQRIRQTPTLSYFTDSDTDVTVFDDYPPTMPRYGSREFLEADDSNENLEGNQVPVEINGVVKAPEKVLMKWLRDGSLKTTITNAAPLGSRPQKHKDAGSIRLRSPDRVKRLERARPKQISPLLERQRKGHHDEMPNVEAMYRSKGRRLKRREASPSRHLSYKDDVTLSDAAASNGKFSERTLKRGYPYSKDPYEYVETVFKTTQKGRMGTDDILVECPGLNGRRLQDKGSKNQGRDSIRNLGRRKSRRNISDILARMSRRRELKRDREKYQDFEFHNL